MVQKKLHLQGLRGLAIIAVILFHFFPKWCPNGYLGVDQFFLLSGFLMTMMLRLHSSLNTTVILDFLYRRVKRIVPLYYLVTALTLVSINLMPKSAFNTNFTSGIRAILLVTNLIRPLGNEDYAEKLGLAVDMFTHTWSLALEMQFYLLFPMIYILTGYFTGNRKNYVIAFLGALSLAIHLYSDSFLSFNSVFSRIWQFLAGMFIFSNPIDGNNSMQARGLQKLPSIEKKTNSKTEVERLCRVIMAVSICSMALLMFGPYVIEPVFGRLNIILLTGLIVYLGEGSLLLENQPIVFLGEISYCWYLVHWPIVALCKINGFTGELELCYALIGTFFLSLVIHYGFEQFYLKWEKKTVGLAVVTLLLINGGTLLQIYDRLAKVTLDIPVNSANNTIIDNDPFFYASDHLGNLQMGYENMTKEQRCQLNDDNNAKDIPRLFSYPCVRSKDLEESRCVVKDVRNITSQPLLSVLVMGNSYAQNVMSIIHSECQDVFTSMYISAVAGCEPLYRTMTTEHKCEGDAMFQEDAEKYKPDVLFIFTRHIDGRLIVNGTNPFDDYNFATSVKRLNAFEKIVKKKIYILDALPELGDFPAAVNEYLKTGKQFKDSDLLDYGPGYRIARERMVRLVQGCSKCELFDYATQFYINGEFKLYDPKYHISFVTHGRHLTPQGLARVRPLIHRLCHHL